MLFSLLGAGFIIAFINCRISYDEDGFVARNFFGAKRRFTYDQLTAIKENMREAYLYNGERKVLIDELSVGGRDFITYAKKRYRTIHNGQALPKIKKSKRDIFNGNVEDAAGFIFAYILMSVLILAIAIFFGMVRLFIAKHSGQHDQARGLLYLSSENRRRDPFNVLE